ncbi:MAG: nucleoside deaminase, partial [Flavobacteriales bacterium]|nr:nucleoside deaminase [Flavobacteriales bacterium]
MTDPLDEQLMRQALREAEQAFKQDEVPIGAVVAW